MERLWGRLYRLHVQERRRVARSRRAGRFLSAACERGGRRTLPPRVLGRTSEVEVIATLTLALVARSVRVNRVACVGPELVPERIHPSAVVELGRQWVRDQRVERRLGAEDLGGETEVLVRGRKRHARETSENH